MEPSLANQRQEVKTWLHEIFGEEEVPEYEINQSTIEHLHQLLQDSRRQDSHLKLVTKDFQQKTAEYKAEAHHVSGTLQRLQLTRDSLSQTGSNSLSTLARLGMLLDVRDPSNTCYLLGMQDLEDELEKVGEDIETETSELSKLSTSYHRILQQCNSLQKVLDATKLKSDEDRELNSKKEDETTFFLRKARNYEKEMKKIKAQISSTKVDKSLFHENLVKRSETLKEIQAQLDPLRKELESYAVLPPDLDESKVKVVEYKKELEKLDKQLSECVGNTMM